jgi:hypothetical protein
MITLTIVFFLYSQLIECEPVSVPGGSVISANSIEEQCGAIIDTFPATFSFVSISAIILVAFFFAVFLDKYALFAKTSTTIMSGIMAYVLYSMWFGSCATM